jgi:hypothetical protein
MKYVQLTQNEASTVPELMRVFAEAFEDSETYTSRKPSLDYIISLLDNPCNIVLVARDDKTVVGGLIAYELQKFEKSEANCIFLILPLPALTVNKVSQRDLLLYSKKLVKQETYQVYSFKLTMKIVQHLRCMKSYLYQRTQM